MFASCGCIFCAECVASCTKERCSLCQKPKATSFYIYRCTYRISPVLPGSVWIRMFLGLPDPDPYVRGMDPNLSVASKNSKKNLHFYCIVTLLVSLKNYVIVASKSSKQKNYRTKIARSGTGSVSQRYGSADPDPYQNFTDPQHSLLHIGTVSLLPHVGYRDFNL